MLQRYNYYLQMAQYMNDDTKDIIFLSLSLPRPSFQASFRVSLSSLSKTFSLSHLYLNCSDDVEDDVNRIEGNGWNKTLQLEKTEKDIEENRGDVMEKRKYEGKFLSTLKSCKFSILLTNVVGNDKNVQKRVSGKFQTR